MTKNLFDLLTFFFTNLDFKSKKGLWYRREKDGFVVCQFQMFKFDTKGSGFLNFGVSYITGKEKNIPKGEESWDLRGRYKSIIESPNIDEIVLIT